MPFLWRQRRRRNAARRLRVLLRVSRLWNVAQTEQGALLRVLLIRNGAVSASAGIGPVLWRQQMTSNYKWQRSGCHRGRTVRALDGARGPVRKGIVARRCTKR